MQNTKVVYDLGCNWYSPVNSFTYISFIMVVYAKHAFWTTGDICLAVLWLATGEKQAARLTGFIVHR